MADFLFLYSKRSAPSIALLNALHPILKEEGLSCRAQQVEKSYRLAPSLLDNLNTCDGLVAVMDGPSGLGSAEIGMALAMNKIVRLIVLPNAFTPDALCRVSAVLLKNDSATDREVWRIRDMVKEMEAIHALEQDRAKTCPDAEALAALPLKTMREEIRNRFAARFPSYGERITRGSNVSALQYADFYVDNLCGLSRVVFAIRKASPSMPLDITTVSNIHCDLNYLDAQKAFVIAKPYATKAAQNYMENLSSEIALLDIKDLPVFLARPNVPQQEVGTLRPLPR